MERLDVKVNVAGRTARHEGTALNSIDNYCQAD